MVVDLHDESASPSQRPSWPHLLLGKVGVINDALSHGHELGDIGRFQVS